MVFHLRRDERTITSSSKKGGWINRAISRFLASVVQLSGSGIDAINDEVGIDSCHWNSAISLDNANNSQ